MSGPATAQTRAGTLHQSVWQTLRGTLSPTLVLLAFLLTAGIAAALLLGPPGPAHAQNGDTTAPTIDTVQTPTKPVKTNEAGNRVSIRFSENLSTVYRPLGGAFNVEVGPSGSEVTHPVTSLSISGNEVHLTLQTRVLPNDRVIVSYVKPANVRLQDSSGNAVASFDDVSVDNIA